MNWSKNLVATMARAIDMNDMNLDFSSDSDVTVKIPTVLVKKTPMLHSRTQPKCL